MKRKGFLVKIGKQGEVGKLIPATDDDRLEIIKLGDGEMVQFNLSDTRKSWRNRKYWLMLNKVLKHLPEELSDRYTHAEKIHTEIKLQNGHFDTHITLGEKEVFVVSSRVGSTSFENMGEKRFADFVNNEAKPTILKYFLKDINIETFESEFMSIIFD